jgi:hypothetical protein
MSLYWGIKWLQLAAISGGLLFVQNKESDSMLKSDSKCLFICRIAPQNRTRYKTGTYLIYAFCSNSLVISIIVLTALSILSTEINSYFPWKFSPPVKIFGVGSPI